MRQRTILSSSVEEMAASVVGHVGVSPNSLDAVNNTRCSAACAFYASFQDRSNLRVLVNSTVSRILWAPRRQGQLLSASHVEYVTASGEKKTVRVNREVILSAGTIGSPKVMELSGVGNATILKAAGIEPLFELPTVCENLSDNVHSWVNVFTNATCVTINVCGGWFLSPIFRVTPEQNRPLLSCPSFAIHSLAP
ncbi:aryl-alcohol oxidase [Coprinopsis cinerea AmutBmut pab1-1]|nr:aryl-alcohol oxidase [Coprinopsis cinerea AmutBmut pab1-1]